MFKKHQPLKIQSFNDQNMYTKLNFFNVKKKYERKKNTRPYFHFPVTVMKELQKRKKRIENKCE